MSVEYMQVEIERYKAGWKKTIIEFEKVQNRYETFILRLQDQLRFEQNRMRVSQNGMMYTSYDQIPSAIEIGNVCPVCDETEKRLLLSCQHIVCFSCYPQVGGKCPTCRTEINHNLIRKI